MRADASARRALVDMAPRSAQLVTSIMRHVPCRSGMVVACVWPLPGEPDLRALLPLLHDKGCVVALPETPPRGQALGFRRWTPGCTMIAGRFGTSHPDGGPALPGIAFVPLLAFDRAGFRLGYGGGYYDRTLAEMPDCVSVGFGFAVQEVAEVPREPHDMPLDMIVTEQGVLTFERSR